MFTWLNKIWQRSAIDNPNIPIGSALDLLTGGSHSASGISINKTSALSNPAIWRGISLVSQSVAKLPLNVYRRDEDSKEIAVNHPAQWLLARQPSELYTPFIFKQTLIQHALLFGNGYAAILRNEFGNPEELIILDPEATHPVRENGRLKYVTRLDEQNIKLAFSDCLHIKGLSADGLVGYSLLDVMKDSIGLGIALRRYGAKFFANGTRPSVVVELPPNVTSPEKIEEYRTAWGSIHEGLNNSHRPALVRSGTKVTPLSASNEDSQFIDSLNFDLISVSLMLGCPASKLGAQINTSYASLEAESQAFLTDCLDAWLVNMEQECNTKLLTERMKYLDSHFCEFNRKAIIQLDAKTESELLTNDLNNGIVSWEQARKIRNYSTKKSKSEEFRHPSNVVIEGEEPPAAPAAPPQVAEVQPEAPAAPQKQPEAKEDKRAVELLKLTLDKQLVRLTKHKHGESIAQLRSAFCENLAPFPQAAEVFDVWQAELSEVLPEQREAVLASINTEAIATELWGNIGT